MAHITQILLDQDGVVADFVGGCCRLFGQPYPYITPDSLGCWEIEKLFGISGHLMWEAINHTSDFWSGLAKTTEADALVNLATQTVGVNNVGILTAARMQPNVILGKNAWIRGNYPQLKDRVLVGQAKEFCAGPHRLLIDDKDSNIQKFREGGGLAILVPRHWNSAHADAHASLTRVRWELEKLQHEG